MRAAVGCRYSRVTAERGGMASVTIEAVTKTSATRRAARRRHRHRRRHLHRAGGPVGLRQVDAAAHDRGLEEISGGEIRIGERRVNDVPPKERDIAMVFQNYALYPHMTVRDNMAFALMLARWRRRHRGQGRPRGRDPRADAAARPLSAPAVGGQRQRVAMGRAIVRDPQVFLFDEPLSNLDAKLRVAMRSEIKELHQRLKTTSIYVTHDQIEAMTMGDKIVVMTDGRIEQTGSPLDLYDQPGQPVRRRLHRLAGDELPAGHAAPQPGRERRARDGTRSTRPCTPAAGRPAGRLRHAAGAPALSRRRRHPSRGSWWSSPPAPTRSCWPHGETDSPRCSASARFAPGSTIHLSPTCSAPFFDAGSGRGRRLSRLQKTKETP
jgi:multiple sugar transport system ATP-binding protein